MVRELFEPYHRQADDFRKAGNDFTKKNVPFLPRRNPTLEPPSGTVPIFNHPFTHQPIIPDFRGKVDLQLQDLELFKRPTTKIEYQEDKCGFVIRAVGSDGGVIKKVDIAITYRDPKPECQPPPPLLPPAPTGDYSQYADIPETLEDSDLFLIIPEKIYHYYSYDELNAWDALTVDCSLAEVEGVIGESPITAKVNVSYKYERTGLNLRNTISSSGNREGYPELSEYVQSFLSRNGIITGNPAHDDSIFTLRIDYQVTSFWNGSTSYLFSNDGYYEGRGEDSYALPHYGPIRFIGARRSEFIEDPSRPRNLKITSLHQSSRVFTIAENTLVIRALHEKPPSPSPSPPPPPPPMTCCPNVEQSDQLLRLLLQKVKTLSDRVGVDEFPAVLPSSLITRKGKNSTTTSVPNLTKLLEWYILRFDELIGQFEIDIEIKDTDLTKEGNQSKTVRLPNLAESIAEMFGLLMQSSINTDLLVNICTRTLAETGQDKQQNFKAHQALMAIVDYLGFNYKEVNQNMPLSFKPGEKSFDKLLKETDTQVKVIDFHEKETLNHYLHELLQAAAIIKAAHWRKIDASGDIALQLLDRVYQSQDVRDKVTKVSDKELEKLIKDLTVPIKKQKDKP